MSLADGDLLDAADVADLPVAFLAFRMSPRDDKIAERKFSIGCPFKSPAPE